MAFQVTLQPNEEIQEDINLVISKKPQLRIVLTNCAAYWPGKKTFAVSDAVTTERLATGYFGGVQVGRKSKLLALIFGLTLVLLAASYLIGAYIAQPPTILVGWPLSMIAGGIFVSCFGGTRRTLRLTDSDGNTVLSWVSPTAFGGGVNQQVDMELSRILEWAKRNRIPVSSEPIPTSCQVP